MKHQHLEMSDICHYLDKYTNSRDKAEKNVGTEDTGSGVEGPPNYLPSIEEPALQILSQVGNLMFMLVGTKLATS
jgi:hypothetical protein